LAANRSTAARSTFVFTPADRVITQGIVSEYSLII
jgi:hypothetical protein